jgi:hypothetical protein
MRAECEVWERDGNWLTALRVLAWEWTAGGVAAGGCRAAESGGRGVVVVAVEVGDVGVARVELTVLERK